MTPPTGSPYPSTYDPAPTMRADLLQDEFRSLCAVCGRVTIWHIVCVDGALRGVCAEHTQAGADAERGA